MPDEVHQKIYKISIFGQKNNLSRFLSEGLMSLDSLAQDRYHPLLKFFDKTYFAGKRYFIQQKKQSRLIDVIGCCIFDKSFK